MLKISLAFILMSWMSVAMSDGHIMKMPSEMMFKDGPPALPAGSQISVIDGDPKMKGPFTMRLKFPAKFRVPPHWHSKDENITVIEGEFNMGMGDKFDEASTHKMNAGGYIKMPMKTRHFAFAGEQGAILQVHGMGPFDITYVNPADDPRKK